MLRPYGAFQGLMQLDEAIYGKEGPFVLDLAKEEAVFAIPRQMFDAPNSLRLATLQSTADTEDAAQRIVDFCLRRLAKLN